MKNYSVDNFLQLFLNPNKTKILALLF